MSLFHTTPKAPEFKKDANGKAIDEHGNHIDGFGHILDPLMMAQKIDRTHDKKPGEAAKPVVSGPAGQNTAIKPMEAPKAAAAPVAAKPAAPAPAAKPSVPPTSVNPGK